MRRAFRSHRGIAQQSEHLLEIWELIVAPGARSYRPIFVRRPVDGTPRRKFGLARGAAMFQTQAASQGKPVPLVSPCVLEVITLFGAASVETQRIDGLTIKKIEVKS